MIPLLGSVVAFVAFGAILKVAGMKGLPPTPVAAVNYVLAAVVCGLLARPDAGAFALFPVWALGTATGIGFVVGFYVYFRVIEQQGLSVAQPVTGMSVIVPTLASVVLWHERPSLVQVLAMAGICAAMAVLGSAKGEANRGGDGSQRQGAALVLILFAIQGLVTTTPKALDAMGYGQHRWVYLTILFAAAAAGAVARWLATREQATPLSVGLGLALGSANVAATGLLLAAIRILPGIIVFPVSSVGPMLLGTMLGVLVWGERPARRTLAGLLLALPAVLILSL